MALSVHIAIDRDGGGYRWRLIRRTPHGADVLAHGAETYPDPQSCYRAVCRLANAPSKAIQRVGGRWRWVLRRPDGTAVAQSPAVYRDPTACGHALAEVREATREMVPLAATKTTAAD
jgi:uncharacterized protein YegP (UPF0339 family)